MKKLNRETQNIIYHTDPILYKYLYNEIDVNNLYKYLFAKNTGDPDSVTSTFSLLT
jgi:hypothetical protein